MNVQQHVFRPGRSTTTAIALATEKIAMALVINKSVDVVLRDFSKTFDKGWKVGLKSQINLLNLSPPLQKILVDYISYGCFYKY